MSDSRYAPPSAPLIGRGGARGGTGIIDLGAAFGEAWHATWANFGVLLGAGFVLLVLIIISAVSVIGIFVLVPIFAYGGTRLLLNALDGNPEFSDVFSGFSEYGRTLTHMLPLTLLLMLIGTVGNLVERMGTAVTPLLGSLFILAWTFGISSRLGFAIYFAVDRGLGAIESLRVAWETTASQKLNCAVLILLFFLVGFVGVLCLLIGVIPAIMVGSLLQAAAYRQLAGRQSDAA
jgi:uncharacterized membrane protein